MELMPFCTKIHTVMLWYHFIYTHVTYVMLRNALCRQLCHQQKTYRGRMRHRYLKIVFLLPFVGSSCRERNAIICVRSWRTVYTLTRVILVLIAHRDSGNEHQDQPLVAVVCQLRKCCPQFSVLYSISQEICTRSRCALLCCGYAIVHNEFTWSIYPYSSGLFCWHWGNR